MSDHRNHNHSRGGGRHGRGRHRGGHRGGYRGGRGAGRGAGRENGLPWYKQEGYNDAVASSVDESEVGIKVFVTNTPGFNGIIKQRFSDFIVREIALSNNGSAIAQLTELELPPYPKKNRSIHTMLADAMGAFLNVSFLKSSASKDKQYHHKKNSMRAETSKEEAAVSTAAATTVQQASTWLEEVFEILSKRLVDMFLVNKSDAKACLRRKNAKMLVAKIRELCDEDEAAGVEHFLSAIQEKVAKREDAMKTNKPEKEERENKVKEAHNEDHDDDHNDDDDDEYVYLFEPLQSKEERSALHHAIREYGSDFVVADTWTKPESGDQIIRLHPVGHVFHRKKNHSAPNHHEQDQQRSSRKRKEIDDSNARPRSREKSEWPANCRMHIR
jgi:hypothetical protein